MGKKNPCITPALRHDSNVQCSCMSFLRVSIERGLSFRAALIYCRRSCQYQPNESRDSDEGSRKEAVCSLLLCLSPDNSCVAVESACRGTMPRECCNPRLPLVLACGFVKDVFLSIDRQHTILERALPVISLSALLFGVVFLSSRLTTYS